MIVHRRVNGAVTVNILTLSAMIPDEIRPKPVSFGDGKQIE